MNFRLKQHLEKKFDEEIRFFKGWKQNMKAVGAKRVDNQVLP